MTIQKTHINRSALLQCAIKVNQGLQNTFMPVCSQPIQEEEQTQAETQQETQTETQEETKDDQPSNNCVSDATIAINAKKQLQTETRVKLRYCFVI